MSFQPDERDGDFEQEPGHDNSQELGHGATRGTGRYEAVSEDLVRESDDELESSIITLAQQIDGMRAQLALRVAEYDRRSLADHRHVLSTKQWLAHTLRMTRSAAAALLRTGRALTAMPAIASGAASGGITADGVRLVVGAHQRHPEAFHLHELVFADIASYLTPRDLRLAIHHWEQQVAYPQAVAEVAARRRRRRLSINQTFDGMWSITGELDPEIGEVVATAVAAKADPFNLDPTDSRTRPQVAADALADICRFSLDHDDSMVTSGGERPHLSVVVDYRHLAPVHAVDRGSPGLGDAADGAVEEPHVGRPPLPELSGIPVDTETVRRLACDAGIVRVVTGPDSGVLDVGRSRRTIPPSIRRALVVRDGGCRWDGCDARSSWCDAHHLTHWADGGVTNLDNLMLLCRRHHTAIHDDPQDARARGPTIR